MAAPGTTVTVPESVVASAPEVARIVAVPVKRPVNTALLLSAAGARSPFTTPPVLVGKDQALAATLATKFPLPSRVIA